jgi:hypothetical protein
MKWEQFIGHKPISPMFFEKRLIDWVRTDDGMISNNFDWLKANLPLKLKYEFFTQCEIFGKPATLNITCMQNVLAYGPKVIRLKKLDFEILEKTDVNLHLCDYMQPFKTVVVELPEEYTNKHVVADPLKGTKDITGIMRESNHKPVIAIVYFDKEIDLIILTVYANNNDCYSILLGEKELTIEDQIQKYMQNGCLEGSLLICNEESNMFQNVCRAILNACLYVADYGCKKLGPDNPSHYARLQHYLQVAERSGDQERIARARRNLRSVPIIYELEQDVKLMAPELAKASNESNGKEMPFHWVRGHYKMQPYGPNRSLRKRIRVAAYKVNEHLCSGDPDKVKTVHHD